MFETFWIQPVRWPEERLSVSLLKQNAKTVCFIQVKTRIVHFHTNTRDDASQDNLSF